MKYKVTKKEGVEINGTHYASGHTFDFKDLPTHFESHVKEGHIKKSVFSKKKKA